MITPLGYALYQVLYCFALGFLVYLSTWAMKGAGTFFSNLDRDVR